MAYQLNYPTCSGWVQSAMQNLAILLNEHALLEKKAAAVAIDMMKYFSDSPKVLCQLSKLAREELRHYELVTSYIVSNQYECLRIKPMGYMRSLFSLVEKNTRYTLRDRLLVASIIEARAHERFNCLIPELNGSLQQFYTKLAESEKRHRDLYYSLCVNLYGKAIIAKRLNELLIQEAKLLNEERERFGFFSYT